MASTFARTLPDVGARHQGAATRTGSSVAPREAGQLRVALFSGNYNYVRDSANQALNRLAGHLLARGVAVQVYSPTTAKPAFAPVGDLVSVPSLAFPANAANIVFRSVFHPPCAAT